MTELFNWESLLAEKAYAHFPEAKEKPVIGITGNYADLNCKLAEGYYKSVMKAGGVPIVIPPLADTDVIINTLNHIDGLILSGGADYDPRYAGEEPEPKLGEINEERDLPELFITRLAYNRQLPILGICRGIQTLAMALGGRVKQDITDIATITHSQEEDRHQATHTVAIEEGSILSKLYSQPAIHVNSLHHQAVCHPGERFHVTAKSEDGIIEAMESSEFKSIMGVQWHPECLEDGLPIFEWLIKEAATFRKVDDLQRSIITIDSHCDTPMFFPQEVDFGKRDDRILVDLHKMDEGHLAASMMVAYIPQTMTKGQKEMADNIFDKIGKIVKEHKHAIGLAKSTVDLVANFGAGKKSIMLGIENGAALEGKIENLRHFANRGIVYMTLCHNGDNDICDSAKGEGTHNGISEFGKEVVKEMNRLGVMVDMSHASEKSFYDAIQLSEYPIICSHSSCRALCDHPRNLTDDQMRALAEKGGVMQVTLYNGFLRTDGKATIEDFMNHLEHAIEVMGIDHVGIGTDFDGDGGVPGVANAAELSQVTRRLLDRGYSYDDIQKIWAMNIIRVMMEVQNANI